MSVTDELLPDTVAVTLALCVVVNAPALAVKLADVPPREIVTLDGTVNEELELDSVTVYPAPGAAELTLTVQVVELDGARVVEPQLRLDVSANAWDPAKANASTAELMLARRAIRLRIPWRVGRDEEVISDAVLLVSGVTAYH